MSDTRELRSSIDLAALRALSARCGGPSPPSRTEVEEQLERGFAALMAMEARLQRLGDPGDRLEMTGQIESLRAALEELRAASDSGVSAPLALGFVLPPKRSGSVPHEP